MVKHRPQKLEDELCFAIYSAQKAYTKFYYDSLKDYKLTYLQYITLMVLWDSDDAGLIVKELGGILGLDSGTLTPLLKRMENNGWVKRAHSADDGRKLVVTLTPKARMMEKEIKDHVEKCFVAVDMDEESYNNNVVNILNICHNLKTKA